MASKSGEMKMKVKKRVGITAISLCAVALAVPAIGFGALNGTTEKYEISVTFGDLDLTRKAGVQTLYNRLTSAATKACGSTSFSELGSIKRVVENKRCQSDFMSRAIAKVNNDLLSDLHES